MSNIETDSVNETLKEFTGFNITLKGKKRLEFMGDWFLERGMVTQSTYSEAARKCLDIGWAIVSEAVEKEAKGEEVLSVTFSFPQIVIPQLKIEKEI